MSFLSPRVAGAQIIASFLSVITLGIVFSLLVVKDERAQSYLIIFTIIIAFGVAVLELRRLIANRKLLKAIPEKMEEEEMRRQLGRFVAELFEEDIPYDEDTATDHEQ